MARNPKRDQALDMWRASKGRIALTAISEKVGVPVGTIRAWKNRDNWNAALQNSECNVADKKTQRCKKRGGQPGNKNAEGCHGEGNQNAVGNNGGAPPRNGNAVRHGLYARYLPEEIFEITKQIGNMSQLDILWGSIEILYSRIIFAQPIMHVKDKEDLTKELKSDGINATTYELQFAWDKQAKALAVQSKAMKDLTGMIKQYDDLCRSELATEEQMARIDKLKSEIEVNKDNDYEKITKVLHEVLGGTKHNLDGERND